MLEVIWACWFIHITQGCRNKQFSSESRHNCVLLTPPVTGTSFRIVIGIIISGSPVVIQISVYFIAEISVSIIGIAYTRVAISVVDINALETRRTLLGRHPSSDSVPFFLVQKRSLASGESEPCFIS